MQVRSVLITIAAGGALASCSSTPPCEDEIVAFVMAQDFIKRQLRAPSTADFPMIIADGVSSKPTTLADGRCAFDVRTYVDAQNAFGGTVRENFRVTLAPDDSGTSWSLIEIAAY